MKKLIIKTAGFAALCMLFSVSNISIEKAEASRVNCDGVGNSKCAEVNGIMYYGKCTCDLEIVAIL